MKFKMKRAYGCGILGIIAILLIVGIGFLTPPMMKARRKDSAYYRQQAKQECLQLTEGIYEYQEKYGQMPASLEELRLKTDYLRGMTATGQSNMFRRVEYPYKGNKTVEGIQVIARYHASESFRFILLKDGRILEENAQPKQIEISNGLATNSMQKSSN